MTQKMHSGGNERSELIRRMAEVEGRCGSVAAGGLAHDLGVLRPPQAQEGPRVLGRLIEFARRAKGLSLEELAQRADVDLAELVSVERDEGPAPTPRTVYQLAHTLGLSVGKLLELSGLAEPRDEILSKAALRFAARSEPTTQLSRDEREAFEEFVKVLAEKAERA